MGTSVPILEGHTGKIHSLIRYLLGPHSVSGTVLGYSSDGTDVACCHAGNGQGEKTSR